ncbi:hypothetical protein JWJ90_16645 [Desulfobulbus rhabdoformis]|uniref:pyrrolysine--tRNA(Pyl) ligase small subunit n=1 Tax=Desulfobulbus rhabdoformis TaxID=34032 RepID=UPI001965FBAA|nr:pyrrolysine--tRNA(Pyl) ligase small subunit [Desulfobulbus rhabdoformis]MBM9615900.1 hypothetical protein [Desulfobulbus rhabdoformis]
MDNKTEKKPAIRYYRTRAALFDLISKMKFWPSRTGILHGIRSIEIFGDQARITTHCNREFIVNNSRKSRAARALRNKCTSSSCRECRIPEWKLAKFSSTRFSRHFGSTLSEEAGK